MSCIVIYLVYSYIACLQYLSISSLFTYLYWMQNCYSSTSEVGRWCRMYSQEKPESVPQFPAFSLKFRTTLPMKLFLFTTWLEFHLQNTLKYWSEFTAACQRAALKPSEQCASQTITEHLNSGGSCLQRIPPLTLDTVFLGKGKPECTKRALQLGLRSVKQGHDTLLAYLQLSLILFHFALQSSPAYW